MDAQPGDVKRHFPFHQDSLFNKGLVVTFLILPLMAAVYALNQVIRHEVGWLEIGLFLGMWAFTGLGVTLGLHRMLTHHSIVARAPTRALLLIAGSMSLQGPPVDWAATHQRHHALSDREGDPHSPKDGFWHAHCLWLVRNRFVRAGPAHDKMMADPVARFVQRTWVAWAILGFAIPAAIAFAIHPTVLSVLNGVLWGGFVRVFVGHHTTWSVNSMGHVFGTRPFASGENSRNSWILALFTWGEGWHNNHHAFPNSAFIGLRWYQIDIGRWALRALQALGQIRAVHVPTRDHRAARLRRNLGARNRLPRPA
ncbi:MAG: acyl-CoA desaturase [Euryarchaeota archaeon]|nr:acyl-CoA desaturase [Euryarchaeota archaeon]